METYLIVTTSGWGWVTGILWVEVKDDATNSTASTQSPHNEEFSGLNVDIAKDEKPCSRAFIWIRFL